MNITIHVTPLALVTIIITVALLVINRKKLTVDNFKELLKLVIDLFIK